MTFNIQESKVDFLRCVYIKASNNQPTRTGGGGQGLTATKNTKDQKQIKEQQRSLHRNRVAKLISSSRLSRHIIVSIAFSLVRDLSFSHGQSFVLSSANRFSSSLTYIQVYSCCSLLSSSISS